MRLQTQTQAHMYACTHAHMHTCAHTCTHAHMRTSQTIMLHATASPYGTSTRNTPVQYPSPTPRIHTTSHILDAHVGSRWERLLLGKVRAGTADQLRAMLPRPRWKVGVLRSPTEVPGSSPIQVYSSDEEEESDEVPTSMEVSRDGQELAWSQGTPSCCGSADVIHSGQEEDELLSDVRRRLWKDVSTRQAASHVGSPLQNAHAMASKGGLAVVQGRGSESSSQAAVGAHPAAYRWQAMLRQGEEICGQGGMLSHVHTSLLRRRNPYRRATAARAGVGSWPKRCAVEEKQRSTLFSLLPRSLELETQRYRQVMHRTKIKPSTDQ